MVKKISTNIRLYPIYCLFGWDLLFYYSISVLFLITVKGMTPSQLTLLEGLAALGIFAYQIPVRIIASRFSDKKNILIGLFSWIIGLFLIMISNSFIYIVIGRQFVSIGSCFKAPAEISILQEPLNKLHKPNWYTIVFGKGLSSHMFVNAIGGVLAGFLFSVHGYLPMTFTIICVIVAFVATWQFTEEKATKNKITIYESVQNYKKAIKHVRTSSRLKALLLYTLVYISIAGVTISYAGIYLEHTQINAVTFSFIFAILSLVQAIFSKLEYKIEKRLTKKTLMVFSLLHITTFIMIGVIGLLTKSVTVIVILLVVQYSLIIMDRIARSKYITNFTSSSIRQGVISVNTMVESFTKFVGLSIASILLTKYNISTSYIILGLIYLLLIVYVLEYMDARLGKKPEQYSGQERLYDQYK